MNFTTERGINMRKLLALDLNNLLYKGFHANSFMSFAGKPTGGIYGTITQMCKYISQEKPDSIVVCNDFPPYKRKKLMEGYKSLRNNRTQDPEKYEQINLNRKACLELFDILNISVHEAEGYEADDMFAYCCMWYSSEYNKLVIASNDDDLFQLFRYNFKEEAYSFEVEILTGKERITESVFKNRFKIEPSDWAYVTAMSGGHNSIKGVKGVGVTTAIKILKDDEKFLEFTEKYADVVKKNLLLVELPFDFSISSVYPIKTPVYNEREVVRFLAKHGIKLTSSMEEAFGKICYNKSK